MGFNISQLNKHHDRKSFSCGNEMLDNYLKKQARQDVDRKLSVCFILTHSESENEIIGYYTLSNSSISKEQLSENLLQKLPPSYNRLPVTLLGRLARDIKFKGQDIGNLLLIDALKKSYEVSSNSIGSMAVIVDPIDDKAIAFYAKYGFTKLDSGKMFLPMDTISQLFG
jgi:predicted GNAT family N-acyltransferase